MHAVPRFLFTTIYRRYYRDVLNNRAQRWANVAIALNVIENVALIGLTFIPSAYNYGVYRVPFLIVNKLTPFIVMLELQSTYLRIYKLNNLNKTLNFLHS